MIIINRLWNYIYSDYNAIDTNSIIKRPRVDYRISEYIFDYINKSILEPYKIMQTGNYAICLTWVNFDQERQEDFEESIYNTETEKYNFKTSSMTKNGIKYKIINLYCFLTHVNENIQPKEYANIVYDMIGAFLVKKYKKITKEILDKNKTNMDYKFIEEFKFPALFKDQKYLFD